MEVVVYKDTGRSRRQVMGRLLIVSNRLPVGKCYKALECSALPAKPGWFGGGFVISSGFLREFMDRQAGRQFIQVGRSF